MYGVALQENRYMVWHYQDNRYMVRHYQDNRYMVRHYQDNRCINFYTCTEFEKENKLIRDIYM